MSKKLLPTLLLTTLFSTGMMAQKTGPSAVKDSRIKTIKVSQERNTPSFISIHENAQLNKANIEPFLKDVFKINGQVKLTYVKSTFPAPEIEIAEYTQTLGGINVEHGVVKALFKNGQLSSINAEFYNLSDQRKSSPALNEAIALDKVLKEVNAEEYVWESYQGQPNAAKAKEALYPKGKLVYVDDYTTPEVDLKLAYRFDIYAAKPLLRADMYIDASSGKILLADARIKHTEELSKEKKIAAKTYIEMGPVLPADYLKNTTPAVFETGSGDTRYAGRRNFDTSQDTDGTYILNGTTPSGISNETRSYNGVGGAPVNLPGLENLTTAIKDGGLLSGETADNSWDAAEHRPDLFTGGTDIYPLSNEGNNDDIALDAHWGAEVVMDYWLDMHNRHSYDDQGTALINYVHYGDAYDNAFWNGTAMTYGDGSYQGGTNLTGGSFAPLTSMDVCAHEIGHGICEFTSDLVYQNEAGAMNEGFSDIWAAAVEHYVLTTIDPNLDYDPWGIGEQIDESDGGLPPGTPDSRTLRWMDDPKAEGNPDSYGGENWTSQDCTPTLVNDYCGVHNNSGVLNKWFYFMVSGSGQTFSPGFNKASADDGISDGGRIYDFDGMGFEKAGQIAYLAETMLTPNATFAEMREASIQAATTLFGSLSAEVETTTQAWFAVDVGEEFNAGEPDTISFSAANTKLYTEVNTINDCEDFNTYTINFIGVEVEGSQTITLDFSGSTASYGNDFMPSGESLTFTGTQELSIEIEVMDDAIIEGEEYISVAYDYNGETFEELFYISDNDFEPLFGDGEIELIPTQTFDATEAPEGWKTILVNEVSSNTWKFNGNGVAAGQAYISSGITDDAVYNQFADANTILRSPLINAQGSKELTVSFDYTVGGETDVVDPSVLFDYGEFMYSLDGTNFVTLEVFVGTAAGVVPDTGTFTLALPELEGKSFFLGWRWINDSLNGGVLSFLIDNVAVTATPTGIATETGQEGITKVYAEDSLFILSSNDQSVIAKIEGTTEDLGCLDISLIASGMDAVDFTSFDATHPAKVLYIDAGNEDVEYEVTLFYTEDELQAYPDYSLLIPVKVTGMDVSAAAEDFSNFEQTGGFTNHFDEENYVTFNARFTGDGSVTVAPELNSSLSTSKFTTSGLSIYPNPVKDIMVLKHASETIESIKVVNMLGAVVLEQDMRSQNLNSVEIDTAPLSQGLYILKTSTSTGKTSNLKFLKK